MSEPRPSTCPACGAGFGCGVDTDACWCTRIALDEEERDVLALAYSGCLCPDCLERYSRGVSPGTSRPGSAGVSPGA